MKVIAVVAARPNFMKMGPVVHQLKAQGHTCRLVHTGQHYDRNMSAVFFEELGLPEPDQYLGIGSGSHAFQTAEVMKAFEPLVIDEQPDLVIVAGDVNSTAACALVSAKLGVPVAHVESGLRSFDRGMPEELNRVVTDHLSDLLFVTEPSGLENLKREGIPDERVFHVGNCMVDSLLTHRNAALEAAPWTTYGLEPGAYALATLHRPSNVDDESSLRPLMAALAELSEKLPVIFPVHPRTRAKIDKASIAVPTTLQLIEPAPYLAFLGLMARARMLITDSGGIQEETTALGIPCLTLRPNTERPVTVTEGTNALVALEPAAMKEAFEKAARGEWKKGTVPALWDGRAAERTVEALEAWFSKRAS